MPKAPHNLAKSRFQLNMRRIGLTAWALFVAWGATVGTLYLADAIFARAQSGQTGSVVAGKL